MGKRRIDPAPLAVTTKVYLDGVLLAQCTTELWPTAKNPKAWAKQLRRAVKHTVATALLRIRSGPAGDQQVD